MRRWIVPVLGALVPILGTPAIGAQTVAPGTHRVTAEMPAVSLLAAVPPDSLAGFCAMSWHADDATHAVTVYAVRPAATETNPQCASNEAVVLVRPGCVFSVLEFVWLKTRSPYTVLICRSGGELRGFGIPSVHGPNGPKQPIS